ncbi:MAG: EMC3/TMCO1 family protein [Methanobrevibacter sp.]|nr:EMC3/TMCO1 family protein [Methanobrevibacter sp.]
MVLDIIFDGLNWIFGPIIALDPNPQNPLLTIFLISTIIAFVTSLANKLMVDQDEMEALQKEMKEFQNEMKEAQTSGDSKALAKVQAKQKDFMSKQSKMMKNQFKPMIITFVPIILVFWWMREAVSQVIVSLPPFAYYVLLTPIWHMFYGPPSTSIPYAVGWLGWYILCTFAMSQIIRKFMGFKTGF